MFISSGSAAVAVERWTCWTQIAFFPQSRCGPIRRGGMGRPKSLKNSKDGLLAKHSYNKCRALFLEITVAPVPCSVLAFSSLEIVKGLEGHPTRFLGTPRFFLEIQSPFLRALGILRDFAVFFVREGVAMWGAAHRLRSCSPASAASRSVAVCRSA